MRERGAAREKRGRGWIAGSERATLKTLPATPPALRLTHRSSPVRIQFIPFLYSPLPQNAFTRVLKDLTDDFEHMWKFKKAVVGTIFGVGVAAGLLLMGLFCLCCCAAARRRWRRPRRRRRRRARPIKGGAEKRRSFVALFVGWGGWGKRNRSIKRVKRVGTLDRCLKKSLF